MSKPWATAFYHSDKWKACRNAYIQERMRIDGGKCEECHREYGYIVHHKKRLTEKNITDARITLGWDNLEWVCHKCHDRFDGHGVGNRGAPSRVRWTEEGQPIKI